MVRFLIGFNDIVLIQRPSFLKVTVKRVFFDRCQTQNGFELLPEFAQILYRSLSALSFQLTAIICIYS